MAVSRYKKEERGRTQSVPDPDEEQAIEAAVAMMRGAPGDIRSQAIAAISGWVKCRAKIQAGRRLPENLVFDLGDARLRGVAEAALPVIGGALVNLPHDKPFFELSKEEAIDVVSTSVAAVSEVSLRLKEASDFPFSDGIPF